MSALTAERNTPTRSGELISVPVAAGKKLYAGALAAANSTGYATPGAVATTLTYLGRVEATVDNSDGADGDVSVTISRAAAFKFANSSSDAVTQASLGQSCYIEDDQTVSKTSGSSTLSEAGIVIKLDDDGVWVL